MSILISIGYYPPNYMIITSVVYHQWWKMYSDLFLVYSTASASLQLENLHLIKEYRYKLLKYQK